jgi:hypothetical protein
MTPDQKVYVFVRSNEKSNTWSRPAAPATRNAPSALTGIFTISTITTSTSAPTIRNICFTSAHVTAWTPPIMV